MYWGEEVGKNPACKLSKMVQISWSNITQCFFDSINLILPEMNIIIGHNNNENTAMKVLY